MQQLPRYLVSTVILRLFHCLSWSLLHHNPFLSINRYNPVVNRMKLRCIIRLIVDVRHVHA